MADAIPGTLFSLVSKAKILIVGAGGIGCELLKNLVLSGFTDIVVVDLDTIDVSNLNRQFLFQKEHVGKSKAVVAKESVLGFNPNVNIQAKHDSIMSPEYSTNFFKEFTLVLNALDNRAARSHVNRMCLAANVPLIESGTAGYLGQVTVIKKGFSECYDCNPKAGQKSFPGCTIRNTPSEPIHCIVWAKHLFNQLFGEADPDEDVSPDTADPEAAGDAGSTALNSQADDSGNVVRVSTRLWAKQSDYDPKKLFSKFFHDDIKYLLSMDKLWAKRKPPTPLQWDTLPEKVDEQSQDGLIKDQRLWSPAECAQVMESSVNVLYKRLQELEGDSNFLVWDKDDEASMDFVTACANLRAHVYSIPQKSRFDVKAMAGNIIPAIASTNAVIAGLIVFEALKILQEKWDDCRHVYLNSKPNALNKVIVPSILDKPNSKCYVCAPQPEVSVVLNTTQMTVQSFEEKILRGALNMISPDVMIEGKGTVLISSDADETKDNLPKFLSDFNIRDGTRLQCDDFHQEYNLNITICHRDRLDDNAEYLVVADPSQLQPKPVGESSSSVGAQASSSQPSTSDSIDIEDDLDVVFQKGAEDDDEDHGRKRSFSGQRDSSASKKARLSPSTVDI